MSFRTKPGSNVDRMVAANAAYAAAEGNAYSIIKTQQVRRSIGSRVQGLRFRFRAQGLGFRVQGSGFGGSGSRVQSLRFRVYGQMCGATLTTWHVQDHLVRQGLGRLGFRG
jgi:hypothetical protein